MSPPWTQTPPSTAALSTPWIMPMLPSSSPRESRQIPVPVTAIQNVEPMAAPAAAAAAAATTATAVTAVGTTEVRRVSEDVVQGVVRSISFQRAGSSHDQDSTLPAAVSLRESVAAQAMEAARSGRGAVTGGAAVLRTRSPAFQDAQDELGGAAARSREDAANRSRGKKPISALLSLRLERREATLQGALPGTPDSDTQEGFRQLTLF